MANRDLLMANRDLLMANRDLLMVVKKLGLLALTSTWEDGMGGLTGGGCCKRTSWLLTGG